MISAIQTSLFVMAALLFIVGLGVGLQVSQQGAYAMWAIAVVLIILGVLWIMRTRGN